MRYIVFIFLPVVDSLEHVSIISRKMNYPKLKYEFT